MPKRFTKCVKAGGRVRTLKPKGKKSKKYLHVCYPKGGGSPSAGHVKTAKGRKKKKRR